MKIALLDHVHPVLREQLSAAGHVCVEGHYDRLDALHDCEGLVVRSGRVDAHLLAFMPRLRFIARAGSGRENIDAAACATRGIRVFSSPEGNRDGVGETTLLLLLMLLKKALPATAATRRGEWPREANRGFELHSRMVGIIGYGHMGSAFAERLQGFGVRILAYDKYKKGYAPAFVEEAHLEHLQDTCDVISLHLPLNAETRHMMDASFIARMAHPFWLINTARGALVDTVALAEGIASEKVLGAGMDVLEQERPDLSGLDPDPGTGVLERLLRSDRVVVTPHIAGVTHEGARKMAEVLATKILHDHPHAR